MDTLAALSTKDEQCFAAGVWLFLELPARTLAIGPSIDPPPQLPTRCPRTVAQQATLQKAALQALAQHGVVPEIPTASTSQRQSTSAAVASSTVLSRPPTPPKDRQGARAKLFVEEDLLSRALGALTAQPLAPATAETLSKLEDLHPPNPTPLGEWPPLPPPPHRSNSSLPTDISLASVAKAIKLLPRGIASGPSAWTYKLIKAAAGDLGNASPVCALLTEMTQRAMEGHLCCQGALTASRLVALIKPDGGIRPVAVGEAFYRLFGRILLAEDDKICSRHARAYVGAHQYGIA